MSLLSQLFGGDQRLLAAATGDAGHILPGASGPHVGKIQEALNRLDGAKLAVDSQYGPKTVAAVAAFKTKRNILNTAGKIDNIVGKKTMAALDSEMLAKEQGGGGGGLLLNFKVGELAIPTPALPPLHLLFYFSGVADEFQLGGVLLVGAHGQDVLTDMENLPTPAGSLKRAIGFGGTLIPNNRLGVDSAFTIINTLHNPPSKLIIYGFSAGGVNAQDLCRKMSKELPSVKVDLLVTVDAAARFKSVFIDRTIPANVVRNVNFFQTAPSLNGSRGAANVAIDASKTKVTNNNFDANFPPRKDFGLFTSTTRHGAMQDLTQLQAVGEMGRELAAPRV